MTDVDEDQDQDQAPARRPAPGEVRRYPVEQPDGKTRHQLILITHRGEGERVRGVPLGYADQAAEFSPEQLEEL